MQIHIRPGDRMVRCAKHCAICLAICAIETLGKVRPQCLSHLQPNRIAWGICRLVLLRG